MLIRQLLVVTVAVTAAAPILADDKAAGLAEHEAAFAKLLTGSTLVGRFTIDGKRDEPGAAERYEIDKIEKLDQERWLVTARVKYGKNDVKVPIPVPVKWAGKTPVMSADQLTIPGLGTFGFRVLFHGNRYVGTWQHGPVGGHMYGQIERTRPAKTLDK